MRKMFTPPMFLASRNLNSASRNAPTCSIPVGLGANRTRTDMASILTRYHRGRTGGVIWNTTTTSTTSTTSTPFAFEPISKRRKGFPSETNVKRGRQVVGQGKELEEKLGKEDPCPCGSGRRFQGLLPQQRQIRR